jgi:competence protein ComEC
VAVTVAATVATAPLMAHHFDSFSLAALPANLLALPAVAPAMWLGMLAGIAGQLPPVPVEPINWLNSLCLAYIAQIAHWLASPSWSLVKIPLPTAHSVIGAYAGLIALVELLLRTARRRSGMVLWRGGRVKVIGAVAVLVLGVVLVRPGVEPDPGDPEDLIVRVLDVGQGDSILLDPPDGEPILVDTGPPGAGVAERLRELGVESLAAIVISHGQSDHAGGLAELLDSLPVGRVVYGVADQPLRRLALAAGSSPARLAEGGQLRSGAMRLTALWPPPGIDAGSTDDPNRLCLVLVAEWRHFSMLLPGDAEAEAAPLDPEPIDVLKVAHHGSEDAGLDSLLDHSVPRLAVISVGANAYGHPTPETISILGEHRVPTLRTDQAGEVTIRASETAWTAG